MASLQLLQLNTSRAKFARFTLVMANSKSAHVPSLFRSNHFSRVIPKYSCCVPWLAFTLLSTFEFSPNSKPISLQWSQCSTRILAKSLSSGFSLSNNKCAFINLYVYKYKYVRLFTHIVMHKSLYMCTYVRI